MLISLERANVKSLVFACNLDDDQNLLNTYSLFAFLCGYSLLLCEGPSLLVRLFLLSHFFHSDAVTVYKAELEVIPFNCLSFPQAIT